MKLIAKKYIVWLLVASLSFFVFLPPGQNEKLTGSGDVDTAKTVLCSQKADEGEIKISSRFYELLFGKEEESKRLLLIPGGGIFGAKIKQSFVSVQNPGDVKELKVGDKIKSINGCKICSVKEIKELTKGLGGENITLVCERGGKEISVKVTPKEVDGEYRLGIVLKDGAAGIGTITYIDPKTGAFGGLGHGICDTDTGEVINFTEGAVTGVILSGVKKGEEGKPGELSGLLTDKVKGELYANTECGVFGRLETVPESLVASAVEVAHRDEVHTGEATILSTVKVGSVKEYKIEISDINKNSTGTKSFKIKVTDPALIAITGGVVRGMSGSPILQDGKLVGAVTHVMVANPTEGYGIFIENMLSAAESQIQKAA
ncbi:MAG: SpoIVB peptidase [Clostridia bacterium]|nr:SpoIVB peptidase [Clostridia bacterium]